jgi:MFS family permease
MYFGRRPVFLVASFGFFGTVIWGGAAQSFNSLVASRILCAFFASAGEALALSIVADLFFLHERGRWVGVFFFCLSNGPSFGSIVSGFLITALGWRWLFWVRHIPC